MLSWNVILTQILQVEYAHNPKEEILGKILYLIIHILLHNLIYFDLEYKYFNINFWSPTESGNNINEWIKSYFINLQTNTGTLVIKGCSIDNLDTGLCFLFDFIIDSITRCRFYSIFLVKWY